MHIKINNATRLKIKIKEYTIPKDIVFEDCLLSVSLIMKPVLL